METVEILKAAKAKIEKGWCQHGTAVDADGKPAWCDSPSACGWCALGALWSIDRSISAEHPIIGFLRSATNCEDIADFNDEPGRTQAEVLAAFDRAIEMAQAA